MRIARFTRILAAVIAVGGLTGAPVARAAEPAPPARARTSSVAVARIAPAIALVEPGGLVTASILITDVAGLYGADVRLTFDPTLVQVVDADPAVSGVQVSPGPLLASPFIALNRVENTTGTIGFAATMLNPSLPITGGGVLYLVQFRGVLTGETTLAISYAELSTRTGGTLARSLENGLIKVGPILRLWLPSISR
jgi:hypothetical protein